jgi:hypothetical protein
VKEAELGEAAGRRYPLYAPRRNIYPQSVHGTFRKIKWAVLVVTLGIYYLLPFVRWDRGPNAPIAGGSDRFSKPAVLFLLHRDLAAGESTTSPACSSSPRSRCS